MPQGAVQRVKHFMLRLEGVFRLLPLDTARAAETLLSAFHGLIAAQQGINIREFLDKLEQASLSLKGTAKGDGKGRKGGGVQATQGYDFGEDEEQGQEAVGGTGGWTLRMANTLVKLSTNLQRELVQDKFIPFFNAWCQTKDKRVSGIAFTDTCILFDTEDSHVTHIPKGPEKNIYCEIEHPLLDPLSEEADSILNRFLQTTFWKNAPALMATIAALSIALRGFNVDRAFFGLSGGGVGQSLFTLLLATVLRSCHEYVDMNMYYNDEEMRKQAPRVVDAKVVSGQESVSGTWRKLLLHLFKKHISGDRGVSK